MQKSIGKREQEVLQQVLIHCRKAAGLTQRDLAERLGTFQSRIYDYESGERRLDLVQLIDYSKALDLDLPAFVRLYYQALEQDRLGDSAEAGLLGLS